MLKIGVVGGTGYTGVELLRLLAVHPQAEIAHVTSRSEAGKKVSDMFTNLRGYVDIEFTVPDAATLAACDIVFFATPNGTAMKLTPELLQRGTRVIDLAADFRIKDIATWEQWYGMEHACPEVVAEAVYGLPEMNRYAIRDARVIANPGCYPTAVTLGFLPLIEQGLVDAADLVADAKSGVSGAGRGANVGTLLSEASESFKAYGVDGHRHLPEIRQNLGQAAGNEVGLTFVPHLTPMIRGIEATLYANFADGAQRSAEELHAIYTQRYQDEAFVDVMPMGSLPETRSVRGNNSCRISVFRPQGGNKVVVSSVIDNLVKGAAGQAIQNMNLMTGLEESCGLEQPALMP